ncbi:MAG: hypothetical protein IJ190_10690 [Prevotella sp.]|nr:hypothetical protein [Prevotella sp.]
MSQKNVIGYLLLCLTAWLPVSCSTIDDDLSDCDTDSGYDYDLRYEMRLVTNISTELTTQLSATAAEQKVADALRQHLRNVFSDQAHDVNLSFYDTTGDSVRQHQQEDIIDESQKVYTLNLPMQEYMHLAVANVVDNALVGLRGDDYCHPAQLAQVSGETVDSHSTGIFTARQPMHVLEGVDQTFDVRLYMANCAAAIVIDTTGVQVSGIAVETTGFADGFSICDSVYHFSAGTPASIRAHHVAVDDSKLACYCSVNFPSREVMRTVIETTDPFVSVGTAEGLWQYKVYVTMPDGSVTETLLDMNEPLRAGQLRVLTARLGDDGSVWVDDTTVGVSVTLNWNDGGQHEVPL